MGTFLGQALKSGQGEQDWRSFFSKASAALAVVEKSPPVPGFEQYSPAEIFTQVAEAERSLHVLDKLNGFAIAADRITTERGLGAYHLVVLDAEQRTVSIRPYPISRLEQANIEYAEIEKRTKAGEPIEAVLVSAGPIDALRKAYPNYFLDTQVFVEQITKVIGDASPNSTIDSALKYTNLLMQSLSKFHGKRRHEKPSRSGAGREAQAGDSPATPRGDVFGNR